MMEDGEVDSHSPTGSLLDLHPEPYSHFLDDSSVIQNDWDTLIGTQICSHKHICNPTTGPDNTHTHTCEHTHTHTIGSGEDSEKLTKKRRPSGNKEAVRKYREKQKAVKVNLEVRNAELEKVNQRIPELQKENSRLRRKLQEQGPRQDAVDRLLAENKKLRSLLSSVRRAIDSELEPLEDVSYQKLRLTPTTKVDRGGGTYLPSAPRCTVPAACFTARPVAHNPHAGGSSGDVDEMERSLGWHMECELVTKKPTCHSPREELEDAEAGVDQSTRFGSEVTTPYSNAGTTSSSGSKGRSLVCSAKTAVAARKRNSNSRQKVAAAPEAAAGYQQQQQQQLSGAIPCPVAVVPLPCFSNGPREGANPGGVVQQVPQEVETWQEDCGLGCGDAEMTADSSPPPPPTSLSPPEPVIQSGSTIGGPSLVPPSSKKSRVEPIGSGDLFSSGCFYPDDVNGGAAAGQTGHWNHPLLPNVSDDWLDECDFIDGVCQAHLVHAIQSSCFESQGNEHDSTRSTALPTAATQPPSVCN